MTRLFRYAVLDTFLALAWWLLAWTGPRWYWQVFGACVGVFYSWSAYGSWRTWHEQR